MSIKPVDKKVKKLKSLYEEFVEIARQEEIKERKQRQENPIKNKTIIHHTPCPITGKPYSKEEIEEPTVQDLIKELGLNKKK